MDTLRIPTTQYRAIQAPVGDSRAGFFYVQTSKVPPDLWSWRDVNPREVNRRSAVFKQIVQTLQGEPQRFHERNRGITIVAEDVTFDDKRKEVVLTLKDKLLNGVADGAHTLAAILDNQQQPVEGASPAYVFVKAIAGVDPEQIPEIAGGLNTSQQVDLKSLENLREHFSNLQQVLEDEPYSEQIAYKMNEDKPVDVREVLYYLAVFDCDAYNANRHPVSLFGRKEGIVRMFADQAASKEGAGDSFDILISKAPEILRLRDTIEKEALALPVGRFKAGKTSRIRSETNRQNHLYFINEDVNGKIPLGWIMPMLAGFRANVEWNKPKGTFSWIVPINELVDTCIEPLVLAIRDVHEQENSRPEFVGRNSIAWRMSYNAVSQAILEWQLKRARRPAR